MEIEPFRVGQEKHYIFVISEPFLFLRRGNLRKIMARRLVTSDVQNGNGKYLRNGNAQMQVSSTKFGFGRYHLFFGTSLNLARPFTKRRRFDNVIPANIFATPTSPGSQQVQDELRFAGFRL
jgi:hypothetical protein